MKVYCSECRWYKWHRSHCGVDKSGYQPGGEECNHPENYIETDSYLQRTVRYIKWWPCKQNAKRDCEYFEQKAGKKKRW